MTTAKQAQRTPGPWKQRGIDIYRDDLDGETMVAQARPLDYTAPREQEANAEFIVRACNSHDDLLAALEEALEFISGQVDVVDGDYGIPAPNKAMQLQSAILYALGRRPGP